MRTVRLAYRDNDRTPVIYCIKAMAEQHYSIEVQVVQNRGSGAIRGGAVQRFMRCHQPYALSAVEGLR